MEFIIRGKKVELAKENCFQGIEEQITADLLAGTPDIRKVIDSLDKLGQFLAENETFLLGELMELGLSKEEALQVKKESRQSTLKRI